MDNQPYDLAAMAEADIQTIRGEDLTDAGGIFLDPAIPPELRPRYILQAAGNPYCFRVDDLGVKREFTEGALPLQDVLCGFFLRKKGGCHGTETPGGR